MENLKPSRRVRLRGLVWTAAGILLIPPIVWLQAQLPAAEDRNNDETVLWTPFFRIVRGKERKTHPAEIPSAGLLVLSLVCCAKGWGELLTGVRYGVMLKLDPRHGWPEFKVWLLLLAAIGLALATLLGIYMALRPFLGIPFP